MNAKRFVLIMSIVVFLLSGCAAALPARKRTPLAPAVSAVMPTPVVILPAEGLDPAALMATPFLPGATKGNRPWGNYDGPTIWPPFEIPRPVGILAQPGGQESILLLGDDQREDASFRTDSIMLLTLNTSDGSASVVSFPRDLYVYVPGWTMQRLNVVMERGGFDLMATTFEYNFGVRPKYYAQVNLFTLAKIVDALGGIDVDVPVPLNDPTYGIDVPAGRVHMDGHTSELYVQARYTTSDFDRSRRQQEVLQALFLRLISMDGVSRAGELFTTFQSDVKTNVGIDDIMRWLPIAPQLQDLGRVRRYTIGENEVLPWTIPTSGTDVFLPVTDKVMAIVRQALNVQ